MFAWRKWRLYSLCNVFPRPRRSPQSRAEIVHAICAIRVRL